MDTSQGLLLTAYCLAAVFCVRSHLPQEETSVMMAEQVLVFCFHCCFVFDEWYRNN